MKESDVNKILDCVQVWDSRGGRWRKLERDEYNITLANIRKAGLIGKSALEQVLDLCDKCSYGLHEVTAGDWAKLRETARAEFEDLNRKADEK